ncbi:MAG: hypothetical protein AAFU64_18965, partial [Bacteroidota bacterium]
MEVVFDDVLTIGNQALELNAVEIEKMAEKNGDDTTFVRGEWDECVDVRICRIDGSRVVKLNFGEEGCLGSDGKTRKGTIILSFNRRFSKLNSEVITRFENYEVDGIRVEGTKIVKNTASREDKPRHSIQVKDAQITFRDGSTRSWNSTRIRVWQAGFATPFDLRDDVYSVQGTYSGTNRLGNEFAIETLAPVIYRGACWLQGFRLPSSGLLKVSPAEKAERTVDFGEGTCDNTYEVSIGEDTFDING